MRRLTTAVAATALGAILAIGPTKSSMGQAASPNSDTGDYSLVYVRGGGHGGGGHGGGGHGGAGHRGGGHGFSGGRPGGFGGGPETHGNYAWGRGRGGAAGFTALAYPWYDWQDEGSTRRR